MSRWETRLLSKCLLAVTVLVVDVSALAAASLKAEPSLEGSAAKLYRQAQSGKFFSESVKLKPEILPTTDGRSFIVVWQAVSAPKQWIVSLPGTHGFATDDLAIWHPALKKRNVGVVSLQWWLGGEAYYTPEQIYHEISAVLEKLGVKPGSVMLHGFSRGSSNSYAVAALDAGRGSHYFSLVVASSGGVMTDYPPTRAIVRGDYGEHPLKGTRWVTSAGGRDPNPDRDGIPGMKRSAGWLKEQGAVVVAVIEDEKSGHGALHLNPKNSRKVLDLFCDETH